MLDPHSMAGRGSRVARRLAALFIAWLALCGAAFAQSVTNPAIGQFYNGGTVTAIAHQSDGKIIIGGTFAHVGGVPRANIARLNSDGSLDTGWSAEANGSVYAIAVDGSGNIYVGGSFSNIGGAARNNLAKLSGANGAADASWNPAPNAVVYALSHDFAGNLYVGGAFTVIGGQARNRVAKVSDSSTGVVDASWNPNADGTVLTLRFDPPNSVIYVGGEFTSMGGSPRNRLAKVTTAGALDPSWNPNADGRVRALVVDSSNGVFAGGDFTNVGGQTRAYVAKLSASTGAPDAIWDANASGSVYALDIQPGVLLVAGWFDQIGSQSMPRLAKLSQTGTGAVDTAWNPGLSTAPNSVLQSLFVGSGKVVAGGNLQAVGSSARGGLAIFSASTAALQSSPVILGKTANVSAIVRDSAGRTIVGGLFIAAGDLTTTRFNIARFNADGTLDTAWNPSVNEWVFALALDGSDNVFLGGQFSKVGGLARNSLAKVSSAGTVDATWNPDSLSTVTTLATDGSGNLYVGGSFSMVGGQTRMHLARVSQTGSGALDSWDPAPNAMVSSLVVSGTSIYVGGQFTSIAGQARNRLARLSAAGTADTWNPDANGNVVALALHGGNIYAVGNFGQVGGQARNFAAKISSTGTVDATWNPNPNGGPSTSVLSDGTWIYMGGHYTQVGGQNAARLARMHPDTGAVDAAWTPNPTTSISAMAFDASAQKLHVGGHFTQIGGATRSGYAVLSAAAGGTAPAFTSAAPPAAGVVGTPYTHTFTASGSPAPTFALVSGGFPPGISLTGNSLGGTPTTPGTYTGSVSATNANGSVTQGFSITITASATVPGSPTAISAVAGNAQALVSFSPPASNGGSAITGYTVTSSPGGFTGTGSGSPILVSGLTNGTSYTFTVTATNAVGTGAPSSASNAVTPATLPGAPVIGTAIAGNAQATVSFTPPASNGGAAITSYTATSNPGSLSASGGTSPIIVNGLTNGVAYTFTVTATNVKGTGPASSASNSVTPSATATGVAPPAISTTASHTLALDADGKVYAWGSDTHGQLGQGRSIHQTSPVQVTGLPAITHIALHNHALAVDAFKQVWSWGDNSCGGQLGPREEPVTSKPSRVIGARNMTRAAAGFCYSLAVRIDGTVWGWGSVPGYANATIGSGLRALSGLAGVTDIAAGHNHALALKSDGTVLAFGDNGQGQLGQGTSGAVQQAVSVPGLTSVTRIAAGQDGSMALLSNGTIMFWGRRENLVDVSTPTALPALPAQATAIAFGGRVVFAAVADGRVFHFNPATNAWAQEASWSGIGAVIAASATDGLFGINGAGQVIAGSDFNASGQMGQGHTNSVTNATAIPGMSPASLVVGSGSTDSVMALKTDGTVWFWGADNFGQSGNGATTGSSIPRPVNIPATIVRIATGNRFSVALDSTGNVWGWGENAFAPFGLPNVSRSTPALIPGLANVKEIAAGHFGLLLALHQDGTVSRSGPLPSAAASQSPAPVPGLSGVVAIAAGSSAYAVKADGTLQAFGANPHGELGNGTTTPSVTPVPVTGIAGSVTSVAAANHRAYAVTSDGKVWSWGQGALGNGTAGGSTTPVQVPGITDARMVAPGALAVLVLRQGGALYLWGDSRLADASSQNLLLPYPVSFHEPVRHVAQGAGHSLGYLVGNGGLAWGFGFGTGSTSRAAIGDGSFTNRSRPVVIAAPNGAGSVDTNDWYLDLDKSSAESIPAASIPKSQAVTHLFGSETGLSLNATIKYKAADFGKRVNNYVISLVPAEFFGLVKNAPGTPSIPELKKKAKNGVVLAQLTPAGWTNVNGQIIAYSQATASAAGNAASILSGVNAQQIPGARFCIGYGENSGSLLSSESLTEVLQLEGATSTASGVPCVLTGLYIDGPASSTAGTSVTFRGSVVGLTPTGTVQMQDGSAPLGSPLTLSLSNDAVGSVSLATSSLAAGSHSIGGIYGGDAQNSAVSAAIPIVHTVVNAAPGATVTTLSGPSSSDHGSSVAFTATVAGNAPGGSVVFRNGSTDLDTVPLVGGVATLRTSALAIGSHSITASYAGDSANAASTSSAVSHTVYAVIVTAISLSASPETLNEGGTVTLTATVTGNNPTGSVTFRDGGTILGTAVISNGTATLSVVLPSGPHAVSAEYAGDGSNQAASSPASFVTVSIPGQLSLTPAVHDFGGQSMRTTQSRAFALLNTTTGTITVSSVTVSGGFALSHDCSSILVGGTCTATVSFTPTAEGAVSGTLTAVTSAGTFTALVAGTGEKSLVSHYYSSILRRPADAAGKAFWEAEAARVAALGANLNETWYAMALSFYGSAEYLAFNSNPTEYVRDLYNTFFNRPADDGGLAYWTGLLASGMPREVVLAGFMFSTEFNAFTQAIFGSTSARAEVDTVVDFYRGLLSRLPDTAGFNYWVGQFRQAQCQGPTAIYAQVESISSAYANSPEYAARNRTNAQYVGDLYNAFLRRGGDLEGVQFWISQLDTGARTREKMRQDFITTPEFSARVANIVNTPCLQ